MNTNLQIRPVSCTDAARLVEIYAPYVEHTCITFEYDVPSIEEFAHRVETISANYPYLVAEQEGRILGYVYASPFKGRAAFDWSVETSIYVDQNASARGIGTALYQALEDALMKQNIYNLYACISYPNDTSIRFHEKCGYKTTAHFHNCGYKLGAWRDIIWMEKRLQPYDDIPKPFLPAKEKPCTHRP